MKSKRLPLAFVLIAILLGLAVYSQLSYQHHQQYPLVEDILSHYSDYTGQKVPIWGDVLSVDGERIMIEVESNGNTATFALLSGARVALGDQIEALGTLGENFTLVPDKLIAHKKWKNDLILVRSAVAVPLILFLFFKGWRFDRQSKRFTEKA